MFVRLITSAPTSPARAEDASGPKASCEVTTYEAEEISELAVDTEAL